MSPPSDGHQPQDPRRPQQLSIAPNELTVPKQRQRSLSPGDRTPTGPPSPGLVPVGGGLGVGGVGGDASGSIRRSGSGAGHPATSPKQTRTCQKCQAPLTGQFVRALGGTFHLDCFKCRDCGAIVASKFFPVEDESGNGSQYPLCEKDYFRRLDLLCHDCGEALRGSYITALDRKYHIEHFTCCVCPTVFGPQDSYYEHDGKVYCHYHYSTQFAQKCNGCQTAILKQFVEIYRNGQNQHWHPECYMIHKFWNVRLAPPTPPKSEAEEVIEAPSDSRRSMIREAEEQMEQKVYRIWSVLSTFEESSAACISDMLLHVSNGAYIDGVFVAEKFIWHVEILFGCTDNLDARLAKVAPKGLSYTREAKLLCKKIVAFFSLLSKTQETGVKKLGVTQELLSLVTGLAHYLKLLIRISLQGALRLERDHDNAEALELFLEELSNLEAARDAKQSLETTQGLSQNLADSHSDLCAKCRLTIEDECITFEENRWHLHCLMCSSCNRELKGSLADAMWAPQERGRVVCRNCASTGHPDAKDGFQHISRLKQYIFLLRVALARLLVMLRQGGTIPHTSDDPNLQNYDSSGGHKVGGEPPLLRSESRSKSYGGERSEAYTNTVNDIRRLRSTRLDKQLGGSSARKARQSRIIEAPQADSVRPGSSEGQPRDNRRETGQFRIIEDNLASDNVIERSFGDEKALLLDDIPRIVAAEQAREQRPNAYKHQRPHHYTGSSSVQPRLVNGHQREISATRPRDGPPIDTAPLPLRKRYFSELTALDSFIVRHLAVLNMEPLVQGHFNLEELLGLIETNKKTFWGKFGKAFQQKDNKKVTKKKGVFGIPLEVMIERDGAESGLGVGPGNLRIPQLVDDAITAMKQMDMSVEGVFRKNGNIRRLNTLAEALDRGDSQVDMSAEGPVQIAALLKKFLRELPDPLLTFKLHRLFVTSQKAPDEETKRRILHLTCCLLPKCHRDCMEILFSFLNWTASFAHIEEETGEESGSKMDIHNLSTVITPNILYSKNKDAGMDDSFLAIEAVHTLIEYNEDMCEVPEDLLSILNDPNLFANGPEVTTKDILKRYGDIANRPPPKQHMIVANSPPQTKEGNRPPSTPVFHRVDSDLTQSTAWQKETSARPSGVAVPVAAPPTQANPAQPTRGHARADSGSSQPGGSAPNGQNDQNPRPGQNGQEEYRNWGPRQPSQTHQPIGA
ncbi:hypothetical protein FN846DRAFT_786943 [Sphaerosporella brunnea]|uniref:Rho-type GTPase-activating protein 1 n=1 Tax=Sphaerosporella brunnea TaxID=1250544 RepID=A0A5J5EHD8_9PEZI|nr:hypothetical protein FN846DRAFT_786943 [Sphaerosporella brunnea]